MRRNGFSRQARTVRRAAGAAHASCAGALLSYVLTLSDVPPDQNKVLAQLVVRYALVGDPRYIGELREKYQIEEAPPAAAPAGVAESPTPRPVAEKSVAVRTAHRGGRGTRARTDHQQRRPLPRPDAAARRALLRRRRSAASNFRLGSRSVPGVLESVPICCSPISTCSIRRTCSKTRGLASDYSLDEAGVAAADVSSSSGRISITRVRRKSSTTRS